MTEAELKQHLDAAEKNPRELAAATSGLPAETLRYKPAPDKWSILEILGHLADVEIMYGHRIRQMLADEKPVIAPIDQNAWAANWLHGNSGAGDDRAVWSEPASQPAHIAAGEGTGFEQVGLSSGAKA